jgi:predicted esterase
VTLSAYRRRKSICKKHRLLPSDDIGAAMRVLTAQRPCMDAGRAGGQGHLLLLHGTGDDKVHCQRTEALINKLIAAGKRFAVDPNPSRSHSMTEGEHTNYHR